MGARGTSRACEGRKVEILLGWKGQRMFGGWGRFTPTGQTTGYVNLLPTFLPDLTVCGISGPRLSIPVLGLDIALAGDTVFRRR